MDDFEGLEARYGGVVATSFRNYRRIRSGSSSVCPRSRRCDDSLATIEVEPWRRVRARSSTESDLIVRQFFVGASRQCAKQKSA